MYEYKVILISDINRLKSEVILIGGNVLVPSRMEGEETLMFLADDWESGTLARAAIEAATVTLPVFEEDLGVDTVTILADAVARLSAENLLTLKPQRQVTLEKRRYARYGENRRSHESYWFRDDDCDPMWEM